MNIEILHKNFEISLRNNINLTYTKYKFYRIDKERFENYSSAIKRNGIMIKVRYNLPGKRIK